MSEYRHARFRRARRLLVAVAACAAALVTGAPAVHAAEPGEPSDVAVKLPSTTYSRMLVDQARQRVYVTTGALNETTHALLVYDFDGNLLRTVKTDSLLNPGAMMLSADGSILYVTAGSYILLFNPDTFAYVGAGWVVSDFFRGRCSGDLVATGSTLWYTRMTSQAAAKDCATEQQAVFNGDLLYGSHPQRISSVIDPKLTTSPAGDKLIETYATYGTPKLVVDVYGTSTPTTPPRLSERAFNSASDPSTVPHDIAVSHDGSLTLVAAGVSGTKILNTTGLTDATTSYGPLPQGTSSTAVAYSTDGALLARGGSADGTGPDLLVQSGDPTQGDTPREYAFTDGADGGDRVADRGLAFSTDNSRLFAMTTDAAGDAYWLHIITNPDARYHAAFDTPLTTQPATPYAGQAVQISGKLRLNGPAPATPPQVTAVRHDADGDHTLPAVTTDPDGAFALTDTPTSTGEATYTVSYAGDAAHDPAPDTTLTVDVTKAPTELTLDTPTQATTTGVELHGTLTTPGAPLPDGTTLHVQRLTKKGAADLPDATVNADGTFTVTDTPPGAGSTLYTVTYAGDALHDSSADWTTLQISG